MLRREFLTILPGVALIAGCAASSPEPNPVPAPVVDPGPKTPLDQAKDVASAIGGAVGPLLQLAASGGVITSDQATRWTNEAQSVVNVVGNVISAATEAAAKPLAQQVVSAATVLLNDVGAAKFLPASAQQVIDDINAVLPTMLAALNVAMLFAASKNGRVRVAKSHPDPKLALARLHALRR